MAKVKKTPEEKLIGQIDKLAFKQLGDNALIERMTIQNSKISQNADPQIRKKYLAACEMVEAISKCVQRRGRALKKKGEKLSELRTLDLPV